MTGSPRRIDDRPNTSPASPRPKSRRVKPVRLDRRPPKLPPPPPPPRPTLSPLPRPKPVNQFLTPRPRLTPQETFFNTSFPPRPTFGPKPLSNVPQTYQSPVPVSPKIGVSFRVGPPLSTTAKPNPTRPQPVLVQVAPPPPRRKAKSRKQNGDRRGADRCTADKCRLPYCNCGSSLIPGKLKVKDIPQLVMITFDDSINDLNWDIYREIFTDRQNPNGCPILGTFYVSHEWTDYSQVQTLYATGHEMASHSIT